MAEREILVNTLNTINNDRRLWRHYAIHGLPQEIIDLINKIKLEMNIEEKESYKNLIDSLSYEELLRRWRFGFSGDPIFKDDVLAKHFAETMAMKSKFIDKVAVSKKVGWDI